MKPNFALSLSFEGIRLLHRTGSGSTSVWTLVGEVAIDAPDLTSQLAMLRKTGLALDPQGLRTKLLIPNDQIKYLSLDTTRASDDDVRAALDGATPYAVSDLTFDYVRGGGRTHIAAVARETLAEAEAFAAEHRFGPVSFAGVPAPFTYVGEPFFGPTSIAERFLGAGQRVERDEAAVAYQPKSRMPVPHSVSHTADATEPDTSFQLSPDAPVELALFDTADPAQSVPLADLTTVQANDGWKPIPIIPIQSDRIETAVALTKTLSSNPVPGVTGDATKTQSPIITPNAAEVLESVVDQSLGRPDMAEQLHPNPGSLATRDQSSDLPETITSDDAPFIAVSTELDLEGPSDPAIATRDIQFKPLTSDIDLTPPASLTPEPVFASRARSLRADPGDVPVAIKPLAPTLGSRTSGQTTDNIPVFSRRAEPPVTRPPVTNFGEAAKGGGSGEMAQNHIAGTPAKSPFIKSPAFGEVDRPSPLISPTSSPDLPTGAVFESSPPKAGQPVDVFAPGIIPIRPNPDFSSVSDADRSDAQAVPVTSGHPAVLVNGASFQAGKPAPTVIRRNAGSEGDLVIKPTLHPMQPSSEERPPARPTISSQASGKPRRRGKSKYLALILTLILLAFMAAVAAWASFMTDTGLAGLFGGESAAGETETAADGVNPISVPDMTVTTLVSPAQSTENVLLASPLDADPTPDLTDLPNLSVPDSVTDVVAAIPAEPATVNTELPSPDSAASIEGAVVSPAEADRIYAATGVWLRAPRLPLIPTADPVGTFGVATLDSGLVPSAQPVMPALAGAAPDQSMLTPIDPPAPGTVFERDARGFILATPEGTLTPDGILVFAGAPGLVPPNRPGTPEPVAVVQAAPRIIAASAPPLAPRPETDTPETVSTDPATVPPADTAATAGGVGLGSLGPVVRPLQRPGGLIPEVAQPEIAAPVLVAFAGPAPQLRPVGLTPQTVALPDPATDPSLAIEDTVAAIMAATPPDLITSDSPLAVASARIPEARPQNFAEVVASAQTRQPSAEPQNPSLAVIDPPPEPPTPEPVPEPVPEQPAAQPELLPESAVADETVAPSGPIPGGVAANATLAEAMDLRAVNLIGVFGRPNDRRALVRLSNGRYVRVGVGDSLDGGQVAAIGDNALNYVKRGQTITIAIPNG